MKRSIILLLVLSTLCSVNAIEVEIHSGVQADEVVSNMERNASLFLTEVNSAGCENRALNLSGITCDADFEDDINMLWENVHFTCKDEHISTAGIQTKDGYQIRSIIIRMIPLDETILDESSSIKEGILNFTSDGRIRYFVIADDTHVGTDVLQAGNELNDLTKRLQILDFVEQFRTAYNKKDIRFIEDVFSEDALIIVGKVIRRIPNSEIKTGSDIVYRKETKSEYVSRLRQAFNQNSYIDVRFDDINVYKHPNANKYPTIYGVLVTQHWNSSTYSDVGYVFMLWDFTNVNEPKIRVRTWQPKYLDESQTQELDEDDIFDPSFFDMNTK